MTTTTTNMPTVAITLKQRRKLRTVDVPAVWVGSALAIHRGLDGNDQPLEHGRWILSHLATGARVTSCGNRRKLERFARAWDERFGQIRTIGDAKAWPHREAFAQAVRELR